MHPDNINYLAAYFIDAMAVQANIEGMKAENMSRQHRGEAMAYTEADFFRQADVLSSLANQARQL